MGQSGNMGMARNRSDCCLVFALWLGISVSLVAIVLYVLLLDVDPPHLKPRQALENVAAAIVYTSHSINILVNGFIIIFHLSGKNVLDEPALVLFWSYWSLLDHFTARLVLHLGSFLLVLVEAFLLQHLFRQDDDEDDFLTRKVNLRGHENKLSTEQGESNVL